METGLGFIYSRTIGFSYLALHSYSTPVTRYPPPHLSHSRSKTSSLLHNATPSHLLSLLLAVPIREPWHSHLLRLLIIAQNFPLPSGALMVIMLSSPGQVNSIFAFLIFYCLFIRWTLCELSSSHSPVVPSVKLILTKKSGHFFLAREETFRINGNVTVFHTHCHLSEASNSCSSFLIAGINS